MNKRLKKISLFAIYIAMILTAMLFIATGIGLVPSWFVFAIELLLFLPFSITLWNLLTQIRFLLVEVYSLELQEKT